MTGPENYVKDIESSDKLSTTELSVLNAYVEAEFRKFSEDNEINESNRDKKQEEFNTKIDEIVEAEKEKALFAEIIKFDFELTDLATQIDLQNLQNDVDQNTDKLDSKSIENKIKWKFTLFNWVKLSDISDEIAKLWSADQTKIIDLLSKWKVTELQKILWKDNLPKYWFDWKFWSETLSGLEIYTNDNADNTNDNADNTNDNTGNTNDNADNTNDNADNTNDNTDNTNDNVDNTNEPEVDPNILTEVTDETEKAKITSKLFDITEFKRWKIQKNWAWLYFAEINATIDWTEYEVWSLKFDADWNLLPDQLIKTTNKEREALYFVDDNKIKFLARYSDWMYLTKDTVTWITPIEKPESLDNQYGYKPTEFNLMEWSEVHYEFKDDLWYSVDDLEHKHPKLKNIMDKIIDEEEWKENLSRRKFKINLSPNDWLAKIILDIDSGKLDINRDKKWRISTADIKKYFPYYEREWWMDNERRKIAMILNQADQNDLLNFAYDAQSYWETYKEKFQQADRFDQIADNLSSENILEALCDFNTDWQISVVEGRTQLKSKFKTEQWKYPWRRKDFKKEKEQRKETNKDYKKSQEWIWDAATIFGPQLYSEINRAIAVLDVKLKYEPDTKSEYMRKYNLTAADLEWDWNDLTWEKIVIENIMRNIAWTTTNPSLERAISNVKANQRTKQKLLEFAQNFTWKEWFDNYWNFQPLFAKAIEELNWSSATITPDLVDNLTGVERLDTWFDRYSMIEKELNAYFSKHPEMEAKFKSDWFTDTKHTFITWLMSVLDNLQVSLSPDQWWITKSFDTKKYRHKLENEFTRNLIWWWLTFNPNWTIWLKSDIWKYDFSENWKFVRWRNVWPWVQYNAATWILAVTLSASAEAARQYNYKWVITSRLDDIKTWKYIWLQWWTTNVWWELAWNFAWAWVAALEVIWKQDPKQWVEQMTRQYRDISSWIFYLPTNIDSKHIQNKASLEKYLTSRLTTVKNWAKEPFKTFIANNEWFLKWNIKNISDYFDKKWIFKLMNDMPTEFAWPKKRNAINNLIQVLQTWIVDSRRDYMYDQLHWKVSVTKLGWWIWIWYMTVDWVSFGIPFPTLNFNISTWRKNYVSWAAGKYMDQEIIRNWQTQWHTDEFQPDLSNIAPEQRLNAYAEYIESIYNINDNNRDNLFAVRAEEGKIIFTSNWEKKIKDMIDIRCKVDQDVLDNISYSEDWTTLTIWDVGWISAFTSSDGQSSRNFLIIWQTWTVDKNNNPNTAILKYPHPPQSYIWDIKEIKPITYEKTWLKSRTYQDISDFLDSSFIANWETSVTNIEDVKTEILSKVREISGNLFIDWLNGQSWLSKFPTTWTLIFTKNKAWTIEITSSESPTDKLDVQYYYIETSWWSSEVINNTVTNTYNFENLFSYPDIDEIFEDPKVLEELARLDNWRINTLNDFLDKASHDIDSDNDVNIDDEEYQEAAQILKKFLWSNYQDIVEILDGTDIDSKVLVINRMKWIFATDARVSKWKNIQAIVSGRTEAYKKLSWPSWEKLPDFATNYRQNIVDQLSSQTDLSQNIQEWLFGYTAFYRKWTKLNEWRTFSMTALWATKVLWGLTEKFTWVDESIAKKWFTENLKYNTHDLDMITKSINTQLPEWESNLTTDQIFDLLSWKSLDIWEKIFTLNSECVFYLLWECANESVWLKINWLTIKTKTETPVIIDPTIKKESYWWSITPVDEYDGWIDISARNLSVAMVPWAYEHRFWINLSGKNRFKEWWDQWWDDEWWDQWVEVEWWDQWWWG